MRALVFVLSIVLVPVGSLTTFAQELPTTEEAFAAADPAQRKAALAQIVRHDLPATAQSVGAMIRQGLGDKDPHIRELAMAAVLTRAAGPGITPKSAVANNWILDRDHIQGLRPLVTRLLQTDPAEDVRVSAVSALASLDFDVVLQAVRLSAVTQQVLVTQFYADRSAKVRAKIAAGFGADPTVTSVTVLKLITDAFEDPDYRVRHAAMSGVDKLDPDTAMTLVMTLLGDQNRNVRAQAAAVLLKSGSAASAHIDDIEKALMGESDMQIRELLQRLVVTLRRQ